MLLVVEKITKTFPKYPRPILRDISFSIAENQTVGIIGFSGAGKSTFAKVLLGIIPVDQGEIYFQGERLDRHKKKSLSKWRQNMQLVFQDAASSFNPRMTIGDILAEPLYICGLQDKQGRIHKVLKQVGLPLSILDQSPSILSGGEKQRLNLARALIVEPKLILLDEPTASLDEATACMFFSLLS